MNAVDDLRLVTAAVQALARAPAIMRQTGHRCDGMVRRYIAKA